MFQNRNNNHFISLVLSRQKKWNYVILYLHLYAYVLLSSKVIVFYVLKNRDGLPS